MQTPPARLVGWAAGFVVWTALALLGAVQTAMWLRMRGEPVPWGTLAARYLVDWYACGVFIPLLVLATRRWPLDRRHAAERVSLHLALIVAASVAKIALVVPIQRALGQRGPATVPEALAGGLISEIIAFGAVAAALHALEFHRRYRERETQAAQLQARLSDAQLRALRAQLDPHFLFNTLNAATALLHRDPDAADAMLTRLGELLRLTLRSDPAHETPLHEEMALLERYLAIMRIRFADRVTVRCDVDPRVADALVPSFILQPIVENAFEHGVARLQRPGYIRIEARPAGTGLVLTVEDDGPGPAAESARSGVGLANTRRRLAELYGPDGSLELLGGVGGAGGATVAVRLPLRLDPATA